MVEKTKWTIELSPKTQRILKNRRSRGSAKLNSALFDGFCNVRKHLLRSVEINTNKYDKEDSSFYNRDCCLFICG